MKRKLEDLSLEDQAQTRNILFSAAKHAYRYNSIEALLEGLLTPSEQIMLGRRLWIARMLLENKRYDEIGARLHVGPSTITKVEKWLLGELPDYELHIKNERRAQTEQKRRKQMKENPYGLTALKTKYPLHFLLFPWPK